MEPKGSMTPTALDHFGSNQLNTISISDENLFRRNAQCQFQPVDLYKLFDIVTEFFVTSELPLRFHPRQIARTRIFHCTE